jgi:hypothetical protein
MAAMKKTSEKMLRYLAKLDVLGLRQVRVTVPAEAEAQIIQVADGLRAAYLQKIARNAHDDDPRLEELAKSRLATAIHPSKIKTWRASMQESQHLLFDKKVLTMQDAWAKMSLDAQDKNAAEMRGDVVAARRHGAHAALSAMAYRAAKADFLAYVGLHDDTATDTI